jgi:hypothetical protein
LCESGREETGRAGEHASRAQRSGEVFVHGGPLHGPGDDKKKGRRGATFRV